MTDNGLNHPLNRKLRMALIGGGGNAFIGKVHVTAATLDNRAELVAGALSSDPAKSRAVAPAFGISADRAYGSYRELIEGELQLPADQRVDFLSIATPNFTHFEIARAAIEAGFNVVCDKPLTTTLADAESLARLVGGSDVVFALSHNYSGYPMVRQARLMIQDGELGEIQAVRVNYIQGGLRALQPGETPPRGAWKADPAKAGSGTVGDIGTHAYQLARFVTGLKPAEISCQLKTFHPGRVVEDYGHAMIRFRNDALGMLTFSQVTHGRFNDLTLEVDGAKGSLSWRQEEPNQLQLRRFGEPTQTYDRHPAAPYLHDSTREICRVPGGHPEAFFEAFANVYRDAMADMVARAAGHPRAATSVYPTVLDGVEGVEFTQQCLASHAENAVWHPLSTCR